MHHVVALPQPRWWRATKWVAGFMGEGLMALVWVTGLILWVTVIVIGVLASFINFGR